MQTIETTFGEHRPNKTSSVRLYFFYKAPTGIEGNLKECPHIKRKFGKSQNFSRSADGEREIVSEYEVSQPVTIKMVSIYSTFGKNREMNNIYLDLSETQPRLEIKGVGDFGGIICNAQINFKDSTIKTIKEFKKVFSYEVIAPPKKKRRTANKVQTRKLIW